MARIQYLWGMKERQVVTNLIFDYDKKVVCANCGESFEHGDTVIHFFNPKATPRETVFHQSCFFNTDIMLKDHGRSELRVGIYVDQLPSTAYQQVSPRELHEGGYSLSEATTLKSDRTVNRALRSGRPGYVLDEHMKVVPWYEDEKRKEWKHIDKDPAAYLEEISTATPLLDGEAITRKKLS